MQGEQTHVFPSPSFQFFQQWVNIMLSINGVQFITLNHYATLKVR
jgi:hypothetical protein